MRKRITLTVSLLLLVASFCYAWSLTQAEADNVIMILLFVVILLIVLGCFGLHYNRVITRRNEQLHRILNALDDYRAIVANGALSLDEQEEVVKKNQPKSNAVDAVQTDGSRAFYVQNTPQSYSWNTRATRWTIFPASQTTPPFGTPPT